MAIPFDAVKWPLIFISIIAVCYGIWWIMTDENGELGKDSFLYQQSAYYGFGGPYNILIYIIPIILLFIILIL